MSQNDQSSEAENPYASPGIPSLASGTASPAAPEDLGDSEERQLRAFVGSKAQYFLDKWTPMRQSSSGSAGFNWAAFFLAGLWLSYRKMYKATLIFYTIIILEMMLEDVVFVGILGKAETPAAFERAVMLIVAIICGGYANRWYLSHARSVLSEVSATGLQGDALLQTLERRGGTSVAASLGMFVLFIAVLFAALIPLEMLLYEE